MRIELKFECRPANQLELQLPTFTMEALKEEGRHQRYLSLLCRYPLFYLDDEIEYEPEQVQGYKYRRMDSHFPSMLLTCGLVDWEMMTLKKTGGFTLRDSNVYDPKSNPTTEPVSTTTVITTVENKNIAAQQQPNQIASMATYKYLLIL